MKRRTFLTIVGAVAVPQIVPRHALGGGGQTPPSEKLNIAGIGVGGQGSGVPRLFPRKLRQDFQKPPKTIPRSPGHRVEWINACKARRPEDAKAGFAYSGPFTEAILLGNIALRMGGRRLEWDAAKLEFTNAPEANQYITKQYRAGWDNLGIKL